MSTSTLSATRRHTVTPTVLGEITIVASGDVIEGVYFPSHWYMPNRVTLGPRVDDGFDDVIRELRDARGHSVHVDVAGWVRRQRP